MKNDRLFKILYVLLEKGSVTAPELAEKLEVSVRTIYRDVEALSIAGVPVCTSAGKGGGISLMPGYALDKALLSDEEQNQVLFAIQSLQATDQQLGALLSKLGAVFQKQNANWIEVDFSRWGYGRVDTQRFELLKTAILSKRVVRIRYCGMSGETSVRQIKPFKLIFKDKTWYLQAFCLKAGDFRLFKISRMIEVTLTEAHFADDFTDVPPVEQEVVPGNAGTKLKLLFSSAVAFRVYDEFNRENIQKLPDGSLLVEDCFPFDNWAVQYLLSFGTQIQILEPPELKNRIADYVKKIYAHYKT